MVNGTRLRKTLKALALAGASVLPQGVGAQDARIDTVAIRHHTSVLAHDSLMGRDTGSPGARAAVEYLAAQCRGLGLRPLGDEYLMPVELVRARPEPTRSRFEVLPTSGPRLSFPGHEDWFPDLGRWANDTTITGPTVFVGPSDSIQTRMAPVPGAVAMTLGLARAPVISQLADGGYAAVIQIATSRPIFTGISNARGRYRWAHTSGAVTSSYLPPIPVVTVGPGLGQALARAGPGAKVNITVGVSVETVTVHNVGCMHPGSDTSRTLAFSAHLDHLGVGTPDATGDSIYNGFSDNAAGVAMLLAIASEAVETTPPTNWAFLFFNAEERGLLGSDAFVDAPPIPLDRFTGVINLDAGAPPGRPVTWRIAGDDTPLRATAVQTGEARGWTVVTSGPTANTDYYPFYRRGVPSIFIVPHTGPYDGMSQDESDTLKQRWDAYHRAHDHWHEDFPFEGLARYASFALGVAEAYRP